MITQGRVSQSVNKASTGLRAPSNSDLLSGRYLELHIVSRISARSNCLAMVIPQSANLRQHKVCPSDYHLHLTMVSTTGRPRTPSGTSAPPTFKPPPIPDMPTRPVMKEGARRSSLGLFGKGNKKQQQLAHEQELLRQQRAAANRAPPSLPVLYNGAAPPQLHTFGGEERPDSVAIISGRANPRGYQSAYQGGYQGRQSMEPERVTGMANSMVASKNGNTEFVDPYARTESMTHRGRYSYASSAVSTINSPRRVRRRKDPTPFK